LWFVSGISIADAKKIFTDQYTLENNGDTGSYTNTKYVEVTDDEIMEALKTACAWSASSPRAVAFWTTGTRCWPTIALPTAFP
jgi:hypothetical protein